MPNAPCPMVSRLTVSRLPRGHVFGYPCDAASAAAYGRLPEWPKGAVCKTVGSAYVGSNPTPATTCGNAPLAANSRVSGAFLLRPVVCHLVTLQTVALRGPRTHSGRASVLQGRSVCTVTTVGVHSCGGRCAPSAFPRTATDGRADHVLDGGERRSRASIPTGRPAVREPSRDKGGRDGAGDRPGAGDPRQALPATGSPGVGRRLPGPRRYPGRQRARRRRRMAAGGQCPP